MTSGIAGACSFAAHATMSAIKQGNYAVIVYPIYIPDYLHDDNPTIRDAEEIFDTIDALIAEHGDVLHAHAKGPTPPGKITAYVSIEGAGCFADDITQIDRFIRRGVVFVGPVHWHDSELSTSATGKNKKKDNKDWTCSASLVFESGRLVRVNFSHKDVRSPYQWQAEKDEKKAEEMRKEGVPTCEFSLPRCAR